MQSTHLKMCVGLNRLRLLASWGNSSMLTAALETGDQFCLISVIYFHLLTLTYRSMILLTFKNTFT